MGSLEKAIKTGFICRLCSEMNKVVIHIYSDLGLKLKLAERIHEHLPVTVSVTDPLPKTVCWKCIARLEEQHKLVQKINYARQQLIARKRITESQIAAGQQQIRQEEESSQNASNNLSASSSSTTSNIRHLRLRRKRHSNEPAHHSKNLRRARKH